MKERLYRQLEIRWINLDPTQGAETRKKRPCVIVQADRVNRGSRTVIVAPLLPGQKELAVRGQYFPDRRKRAG